MDAMDRFVNRENIRRYRTLASESINSAERARIMKLLADEEAKFKLELSRGGDGPDGPSPVNAETDKRLERDGEGQRDGG